MKTKFIIDRSFVLLLSLVVSLAHAESWPQFGGPLRNFTNRQSVDWNANPPTKRWQRQLGEGMSGVVIVDDVAYTTFLQPFSETDAQQDESKRKHQEVILAVDADNGKTRWRYEYEYGWIDAQQAFGGRSRAPQATPLICGNRLITIGFTGIMHCLNRSTGHVLWKQDLVERYGAVPVQFGFSASPVCEDERIYVLSGGQNGGLVCLNAVDGSLFWKRPCNEASYATPVVWNREDGKQIIFVTRNRVIGVDALSGKQLWQYQLPGQGLTNVPTPMVVDDQDIVVSGQGVKGTHRLRVVNSDDRFTASEVWKSDAQFFYCNWVQNNEKLFGCNGNLLLVIDLQSGSTLGRYRGYSDSNLLLSGDSMLVFHGDGHLSRLRLSSSRLDVLAKYSVLDERCWTPPTLVNGRLYCRGGDELVCVDLSGGDPRAAVVPVTVRKSQLAIKSAKRSTEPDAAADPKTQIVAAFERDGVQAARDLYEKVREKDPDSLPYEQRLDLAKMADEVGLQDFADQLKEHANQDFPEIAKRLRRALNPSKRVFVGKNGLTYIEFSIRNKTLRTIQAEVRGPKGHPFGYGLPLRPRIPRSETWPVGTKLYQTRLGVKTDVLLTVKKEFAGKIIDLPLAPTKAEDK